MIDEYRSITKIVCVAQAGKQFPVIATQYTNTHLLLFSNFFVILVIDVYAEWCGPCIAMTTYLKKIKMELGSENLHYAIVNILYLLFIPIRDKNNLT